jgi:HAE1 family hydrophobic/amphiphilic exporter-1
MGRFSQFRSALVFAFAPPAVTELGMSKGFDFQLLDRGGVGHADLMGARNQLLGMAMQDPILTKVRPNGLEDVPEYRIDVDWEKAGALGLPITSIHNTISAAFGSAYVNDFIQGGRVKRVYAQADAPYRMLPQDLTNSMYETRARWFRFPPLPPGTGLPALRNWSVSTGSRR